MILIQKIVRSRYCDKKYNISAKQIHLYTIFIAHF